MPLFKTLNKSLPLAAERLLEAAAKALVQFETTSPKSVSLVDRSDAIWVGVTGCAVGAPPERHDRACITQIKASSVAGARLVHGWCVEEIRRRGIGKFAVLIERHTVIEMPGGQLLCPSTPVGEEIRFFPAADASAHAGDMAWNRAVFSNTPLRGALGVAPAYELAWSTNWKNDQAYSIDPRHARYASWSDADPMAYLEQIGLSSSRLLDVVMTSDLDEVTQALHVSPHPGDLGSGALQALLKGLSDLRTQGAFKAMREDTEKLVAA